MKNIYLVAFLKHCVSVFVRKGQFRIILYNVCNIIIVIRFIKQIKCLIKSLDWTLMISYTSLRKGGGGLNGVTLFLLAKGKNKKTRTQILKRISQKINCVLLINTFTNNIFLTCMAKSFSLQMFK